MRDCPCEKYASVAALLWVETKAKNTIQRSAETSVLFNFTTPLYVTQDCTVASLYSLSQHLPKEYCSINMKTHIFGALIYR